MASRRALLGTLGAVAVGGCSAAPFDSQTPTDSCGEATESWTDPKRDSVAPRQLPNGPPPDYSLGVKSFVIDYEEAYLYNKALRPATEFVHVSVSVESVWSMETGFIVTLHSSYTRRIRSLNGGTTPQATVAIEHGGTGMKAYLVTDERLVRAVGTDDEAPDPRKTGMTLECWEVD